MRDRVQEGYTSAARFPGLRGTGWRARYNDILTIQLGIRMPGPNWSAETQRRMVAAGQIPATSTYTQEVTPGVTSYGPLSPDWGRRSGAT